MSTPSFDVQKIALLARLKLTPEEQDKLGRQFQQILDYIDHLDTLDTANVVPTSHVLPLKNVFREDKAENRFPGADPLSQAPVQDKGHYEVPKIIG